MLSKEIIGFEGLYKINIDSTIQSIDRSIIRKNGITSKLIGKIKNKTINTDGYEMVVLYKSNKPKYLYVHRLMAQHFIENNNNYPCVNHKNGIKNDNSINNLEWCSYSQNNIHSYKELGKIGYYKNKFGVHPKSKKVFQYDLEGNLINTYPSIGYCADCIGLTRETIRDNIKGKIKIILGKYKFKTKND
jgi:hypothetical protein